jgi:tetratricopeptide (TPR) repeat protein
MGQFDEALGHTKEAVRLDPTDHGAAFQLSLQYLWNRRYSEGVTAHESLLELFPDDSFTLRNYGLLLFLAGRRAEGIQKLRTAAQAGAEGGEGYLGWALAVNGQYAEARTIAEDLAREHPEVPTDPAMIYANMHEETLAIRWLSKAARMGQEFYFFEFEWDPIRQIPEVIDLARRSGAPVWSLHIVPDELAR